MPRPPDALIVRYKALVARIGDHAGARLAVAWDQLGSYQRDDIATYTKRTAPALAGSKAAAVAASTALLAASHRIRPPAVNPDDVAVEAKVADPFYAMWHAVGEGRPNVEALAVGRSVAVAVGLNFVVSASRRASDVAARAANLHVRWERVPDANACDWCQTVAGQTYLSADSADFGHDRCMCAVVSD